MELSTVLKCREAFYRLVGTDADDGALTAQTEQTDDVANLYLTRGCRNAQRWMLKMGYAGWRTRSGALSWSGTDETTGGRYTTLPTDFLRAWGTQRDSALHEANGTRWGQQVSPEDDLLRGNHWYIRGDELWITRNASPPTTLYLEYQYLHPTWDGLADADIDFPVEARPLIIAEAADAAKEEFWLPGDVEMERKIDRAVRRAREEARDIARPTKQPRQLRRARRAGNHW